MRKLKIIEIMDENHFLMALESSSITPSNNLSI